MKTESKIYNLFIVIALLFQNPLSFYLLNPETPVNLIQFIWVIFVTIFIIESIFVWLININKAKKRYNIELHIF
jgi:hypothetical protein